MNLFVIIVYIDVQIPSTAAQPVNLSSEQTTTVTASLVAPIVHQSVGKSSSTAQGSTQMTQQLISNSLLQQDTQSIKY